MINCADVDLACSIDQATSNRRSLSQRPTMRRCDGAYLAGDEADAAAMKAAAQIEIGAFLSIPGADHDTAVEARSIDCLVQCPGLPDSS